MRAASLQASRRAPKKGSAVFARAKRSSIRRAYSVFGSRALACVRPM